MTVNAHGAFALDFRDPVRPGQELMIPVGGLYTAGPIDGSEVSSWICEAIHPSGRGEARLIVFRELNANGRLLYRTDAELEALEADGMIRPMSCDPRTPNWCRGP